MAPIYLGEFEYAVLLAILHLDQDAYAVPVRELIEATHRPAGGARRPLYRARPPRGQGLPALAHGRCRPRNAAARRAATTPSPPAGLKAIRATHEALSKHDQGPRIHPGAIMTTPLADSRNACCRSSFAIREQRESIIGDLREEHARHVRRAGRRAGRALAPAAERWASRCATDCRDCSAASRRCAGSRSPPRSRAARGWIGLTRDVLYAWRAIWQRPALASVVVVTLALALAANSTTFSLMDALVLRPYRFAGVERLLVVTTTAPDDRSSIARTCRRPIFASGSEQSTTVKHWALYQWWDANLSGVDVPEQVPAFACRPATSRCLASTPAMGREFPETRGAAGPAPARRARARAVAAAVCGGSATLSARPCVSTASRIEVVGVAPERLQHS